LPNLRPRLIVSGDGPIVSGDGPIVFGDAPIVFGDGPIVSGDGPIVSGDVEEIDGRDILNRSMLVKIKKIKINFLFKSSFSKNNNINNLLTKNNKLKMDD